MTGLNLEPFLRLLRADLGVWISLGSIIAVLGLMAWTSWGSRRALRKCLFLSIAAHVGLVLYGGRLNSAGAGDGGEDSPGERIRSIRIVGEDGEPLPDSRTGTGRGIAPWDRPTDLSRPDDSPLRMIAAKPVPLPDPKRAAPERLATPSVSPPSLVSVDPATDASPIDEASPDAIAMAPAAAEELPADAPLVVAPAVANDSPPIRIRPGLPAIALPVRSTRVASVEGPSVPMPEPASPTIAPPADEPIASAPSDRPAPDQSTDTPDGALIAAAPSDRDKVPDSDLRPRARPAGIAIPTRTRPAMDPLTIARANPGGSGGSNTPLPAPPNRPVADVPDIFRERVAPERSVRAQLSGATAGSEHAVELALEWLAHHQDADGRWNAGTKKYRGDDSVVSGEVNFTLHCPPGDVCSGECYYHEADTAMTGLALLAYLGAGYTHTPSDGKHALTIAKGLQFLLRSQKEDGDLRGESRAVGMYCHAMATLALCEAYGLSQDVRLRDPAARAVGFLAKSRAADGLSWRYKPGETSGDTSLLGWAILVFRAADEVGLTTPASMRAGALGWLNLVSAGEKKGLAVYRPNEGPYGGASGYVAGRNMTPTMTAEAWACRQVLGVGGPSAASDEAAEYLMRNKPDRSKLNLYYWYYGTLAMHTRGGADWDTWNTQVRDSLVGLQQTDGHQAGSWDPADSKSAYDLRGGRIYTTALAAMTLEVYYRYGTTEDAKPPRMAPRTDPTLRRSGTATKPR